MLCRSMVTMSNNDLVLIRILIIALFQLITCDFNRFFAVYQRFGATPNLTRYGQQSDDNTRQTDDYDCSAYT